MKLDLLPVGIHSRVREALTRCLQKDLKKRYSSITEARYEIEMPLSDPDGVFAQPLTTNEPQKRLQKMILWMSAIVLTAILAAIAVWNLKPMPPGEPRPTIRFSFELPANQQFINSLESGIAISPDGSQFVYCTPGGIYLRSMDELDARLIPGTQGNPSRPFFSPDGKWLGYWSETENQLVRIALSGGAPIAITDASSVGPFRWRAQNGRSGDD